MEVNYQLECHTVKSANSNPFFLHSSPVWHSTLKVLFLLENLGQFHGLLLILTVILKDVQKLLLKSGSASTEMNFKIIS